MTKAELWKAVADVAAVLSSSPIIRRHCSFLSDSSRVAPDSDTAESQVGNIFPYLGGIQARPLRIGRLITVAQPLIANVDWANADVVEFRSTAETVEKAHQWLIEWLRARLAGYPIIPAVQLTPGSRLATDEYSPEIPWVREMRQQQLHLHNSPIMMPELLWPNVEQSRREVEAANETVRVLAQKLSQCAESVAYGHRLSTLQEADKQVLRSVRSNLRSDLDHDTVTREAGSAVYPRNDYRTSRERYWKSTLKGRAHDYTVSFDKFDDLVTTISSVLGQFLFYTPAGEIPTGGEISSLEFHPGDHHLEVSWIDTSGDILHSGELRRLADPLVAEVILVTDVTWSQSQLSGFTGTYRGRILPDSEAI
ncbi:hypothetical protein [Pseudonocardia sp. ICBG601]|uniref:hypothetical protein n=1 Tax=Pseudonocardia sp. ICBG601 TaxID=2846759 RepID=UPI001CF68E0C|nr:hypothetical protein [Pseudonocardia sp. ICBG601]